MGRLFLVISPDDLAVVEGLTIPKLPPNSLQQVVGARVRGEEMSWEKKHVFLVGEVVGLKQFTELKYYTYIFFCVFFGVVSCCSHRCKLDDNALIELVWIYFQWISHLLERKVFGPQFSQNL